MTTRIAFLGDTLLGGSAQDVIDEEGYDYPLAGIKHFWADTDLVVANHEAPLTTRDEPAAKLDTGKKRYWYKGRPESAHALHAHGVRVVSLANNHVGDFSGDGVMDTMAALDSARIAHCGAGASDAAARRPITIEAGGLSVGFLSVMQRYQMYVDEGVYARRGNPGPAMLRRSRLQADIAQLRQRVDLCVVLVHWGRNYKPLTSLQERMASEIVEAGADLVIGHHPHIPHPVRIVQGVPVLFSLGNAAFGTPGRYHSGRPPYGLVAMVTAESHRVVSLDLHLIHVDNAQVNFQPRPATDGDARVQLEGMLSGLPPSVALSLDRHRAVARVGLTAGDMGARF